MEWHEPLVYMQCVPVLRLVPPLETLRRHPSCIPGYERPMEFTGRESNWLSANILPEANWAYHSASWRRDSEYRTAVRTGRRACSKIQVSSCPPVLG